jgi:fructose-bisphosphate aldolase class II
MYLIESAAKKYPHLPIVMHQDHGNSPKTCAQSCVAGFTSVMMDGSLEADGKTPASYDYNVNVTKRVVEFAHDVDVSVEGELGCLGSLETGKGEAEDGHGFEGELSKDMLLTDPDQAVDFVKKTGVDALAIAIGTSHGAYKFSKPPTSDVLDIDRIKAIHEAVPNTHLVMHGASSVPQQYIDLINLNGGKIPETYGVPIESIREGIDNGIRKINIDTDLRLAFTAAMYVAPFKDATNFDPRFFNSLAREYMRGVCLERYEAFGCTGQALTIPTYGI